MVRNFPGLPSCRRGLPWLWLWCAVLLGGPVQGGLREESMPGQAYTALQSSGLRFDVVRKGKVIGEHRIDFRPLAAGLEVRTVTRIKVPFLWLFEYKFDYQSVAAWDVQGLRRLRSDTSDNGEESLVEVVRLEGGAYRITASTPEGEQDYRAPAPLFPNNHWNAAVLRAGSVLDTLTGKLERVTIMREGTETVPTNAGSVPAAHYRYRGGLLLEAWYDEAGHLLKLRFPSRDQVPVEFLCRSCLPVS